jgi:hypothetical protein
MTKLTALDLYILTDTIIHSLQFGSSWSGVATKEARDGVLNKLQKIMSEIEVEVSVETQMKIKEVSKKLTYYVLLDEDVDDPEFLWYRTDPYYKNWEVLMGDSWETVGSVDELKEAFIQYHKNLSPKEDIMII